MVSQTKVGWRCTPAGLCPQEGIDWDGRVRGRVHARRAPGGCANKDQADQWLPFGVRSGIPRLTGEKVGTSLCGAASQSPLSPYLSVLSS